MCVCDCVHACLCACVPEAGVCMCLMPNSEVPVKSPTLKHATLNNWCPAVERVNEKVQVLSAVQRATVISESVFWHNYACCTALFSHCC